MNIDDVEKIHEFSLRHVQTDSDSLPDYEIF